MGELSKWNKRIEIPHENEIKRLVIVCFIYYWSYYIYDILYWIKSLFWTNVIKCIFIIVTTIPIYLIYRRWTKTKEKPYDLKNARQYIWVLLLLVLTFLNVFVQQPEEFFMLFDGETQFEMITPGQFVYMLFFYFIGVALVEEFVFRVYVLNELVVIFGRFKWIAPIVAGIYFGIVHYVQGTIEQVWIATVFGIILGYSKLYFDNCTFLSIVLTHGMYDLILNLFV